MLTLQRSDTASLSHSQDQNYYNLDIDVFRTRQCASFVCLKSGTNTGVLSKKTGKKLSI